MLILAQISGEQFGVPCLHITPLPVKNLLNWIRIKYLRWFSRKKDIIVTLGNNTSIISMAGRLMKAMGLIPREQSTLRDRSRDAESLEPY